MIEITMGLQELLSYTNNSSHLTVLDFYADWCGPCKMAKPTYDFLATKFNPQEVKFLSCNVDRQRECSQRFGITGMPTFLIIHGGEELLRTHDVNALNLQLDRHLKRVQGNRNEAATMRNGRLGSSSSSSLLPPLIDKMLELSKIGGTSSANETKSLVESIRIALQGECYREPMGLALLPYLACDAGSSSGNALEYLLSSFLQVEMTRGEGPYRGLAAGVVNNILRYVLQISLELTWNDREGIDLLHRVMHSLLLSTTAQRLLIKSPYFFNPMTIFTGHDVELRTVLGGLLGISPGVRTARASMMMSAQPLSGNTQQAMALEAMRRVEYRVLQGIFPVEMRDSHGMKVEEVQHTVDALALKNADLVNALLRSKITREACMFYFSEVLRLNEGNQKTMNQDLPLSSIYFMAQVQHVLLQAAKPIFDGLDGSVSPSERLPPHYLLDDDEESGCALVRFGPDVERVVHFDEEKPLPSPPVHLPAPVSPSSPLSPLSPFTAYKPFIHLFYLAVKATTVLTVPMIESHSQLERQARHRGRERVDGIITALFRIREVLLGSMAESKLRLEFINNLSKWLLSVMEVDPYSGVLPPVPPIAWQYLPQQVVDCAVKATELTHMSAVYTPELNGLLLVLMGNAVYFPKPHTHVFSYLLSRILRDHVSSEQLQRHPWFSKRIVRSCMNCYIAVEKATYERSQVRFDLSQCLKEFLKSELLCAAVRDEMCSPTSTSLERFSHMAVAELNEAVDQMTETLKKMNQKIKEGADTSPNPPPPSRPASGRNNRRNPRNGQQQQQRNSNNNNNDNEDEEEDEEDEESGSGPSYHQLGLGLHSCISLFFASTDLFISLARCFPTGVSQNMVAQQLSQVLARSLVTFAGRQSGQLKIQNEELYKFSPRDILARLVDCLTPLTSSNSFLRCLCECGVAKEDILDAIDRITSRNLVSSMHQMNLEVMRDAIISFSAEVEKENALWDEAPDFALDALLSTPLTDPVALPADVRDLDDLVYVNRSTIHHLLLSDSKHPFTKEYLDEAMLTAFNQKPEIAAAREALKQRIQNWLTEEKAKSQ